jgi:exodeoxyribonuclease VII large subunit
MELYIEKLKGLSPLDKLNQGFSYISDEKGRTVTDIKQVEIGDSLQIYVKNGKITATVAGKESV